MGLRVHVIKKREKYGDTEAFNHGSDLFVSLLENLNASVSTMGDEFGTSRFACPKKEYKQALKRLKGYKENGTLDEVDKQEFDEIVDTLGGLGRVIDCMGKFLKEADETSDWIEFCVW